SVAVTICCPPPSTLSPYTTLFRSPDGCVQTPPTEPAMALSTQLSTGAVRAAISWDDPEAAPVNSTSATDITPRKTRYAMPKIPRSEEHTSELQSRENLVCRLLLEK